MNINGIGGGDEKLGGKRNRKIDSKKIWLWK
jgi:hypothetical protein